MLEAARVPIQALEAARVRIQALEAAQVSCLERKAARALVALEQRRQADCCFWAVAPLKLPSNLDASCFLV